MCRIFLWIWSHLLKKPLIVNLKTDLKILRLSFQTILKLSYSRAVFKFIINSKLQH